MSNAITRDKLARMYPRALPQWLDAMERLAPALCEHYGFSRLDWCGIAGQIDAETNGLALPKMQENMSFSASRMLEVYSKRLGDCVGKPVPPLGGRVFSSKAALARALAGKPVELADVVYGGPNGREGTPPWCGSKYLGRGPLQNTHANNYRASRDEIRQQPGGADCPDLLEHPELLATDPELGVRDVFAQWKLKGLSKYARRSDWSTLSDVLNTGNPNDSVKPHGLARRLRATATALAIWPADEWGEPDRMGTVIAPPTPPPGRYIMEGETKPRPAPPVAADRPRDLRQGDKGDDVKALQARLVELGYGPGPADGIFGVLTARAVVAFQAEHKLDTDGVVGARTRDALAVSAPAIGEHNNITAADLTGSSTIKFARRVKAAAGGLFGLNVAAEADDQLGLGLVDAAVAKGEYAKGLLVRVEGLGLPMPSGRLLLTVCVGVGCVFFMRWASKIEWGRVMAARRGG